MDGKVDGAETEKPRYVLQLLTPQRSGQHLSLLPCTYLLITTTRIVHRWPYLRKGREEKHVLCRCGLPFALQVN